MRRSPRRWPWPWNDPAHGSSAQPIKLGFYVPWDDASRASLAAHIGDLDCVVPGLFWVTGGHHKLTAFPDPGFDQLLAAKPRPPLVVPMVQNILNERWDPAGMAALLDDRTDSLRLLDQLEPHLRRLKAAGVMFDFQGLPKSAQRDYQGFLADAKARYARNNWLIAPSVPVDDSDWDLAAYGRIADRLLLMDYDEHTTDYEAGPIASQTWFVAHLKAALRAVPRGKAIVGIGSYAYDWTGEGHGDTHRLRKPG